MELLLERIEKKSKYTVGRLCVIKRVDDEYLASEEKEFLFDTLEPKFVQITGGKRLLKRKAAITPGRYPVVITYSQEYDEWLPLILGVRKFKDVRIIMGKTVEDIKSGVIIGMYHGNGRIVNSPNSVYNLKQSIVMAKARGEAIFITIKN